MRGSNACVPEGKGTAESSLYSAVGVAVVGLTNGVLVRLRYSSEKLPVPPTLLTVYLS